MQPTRALLAKPNLLLCLDAFGTLFKPSIPIPAAYARAAARHGIPCGGEENAHEVGARFKTAFKGESVRNPNYGRATGLGAEKWWGNVIRNTFSSFSKPGQEVPPALITELIQRFSSKEGYDLYPDVKDFFLEIRNHTTSQRPDGLEPSWPYKKVVVGIITNSDDRVPGILESFGLKVGPRRFGKSSKAIITSSGRDDIDFVVLSYDVGHEKPDYRIFDAATSVLKETLASDENGANSDDFEKLYVGDDLEKDYHGAEAAGWHTVLLDRNGVMDKAKGFHFGRVGLKNKEGRECKVLMAKSLLDLSRVVTNQAC